MPRRTVERTTHPIDMGAYYATTGLNQKDLAAALGVSVPLLWTWAKAGHVPTVYAWALKGLENAILARRAAAPPPEEV